MDINYWAILVCGVISMIVGMIWYGPIFGKAWMKINNVTDMDLERRKEMQKRAMPLYVASFILTLFQAYVMAFYIKGWAGVPGLHHVLLFWAAFLIPTVAGGAMWNNDSARVSWMRFAIQAGYYLVLFVIFGLILMYWK